MSNQEHLWLSEFDLVERALSELEAYRCWALTSFGKSSTREPLSPAIAEVRRRARQRLSLPHLTRLATRVVAEQN
jgi:hypothetical protein